jgi:hypothetical protein
MLVSFIFYWYSIPPHYLNLNTACVCVTSYGMFVTMET